VFFEGLSYGVHIGITHFLPGMADPLDLYDDRGSELSIKTTALLILAVFFVGLRFWARFGVPYRYGADDWLIVAALVSDREGTG
jgi:hypothetical protein